MKNGRKSETQSLILAALFTALMAVFAQLPPSTHEFPITLQTFAIALCGYTLSVKYSLFSIVAYIFLGAAGAPVFSGFCGGIHHITGPAGGFIVAFPVFVLLCALSQRFKSSLLKITFGIIGIIIMYVFGLLYFAFVTETPVWTAMLMYALVFLKDVVFCIFGFYISIVIRKRVIKKSAQ